MSHSFLSIPDDLETVRKLCVQYLQLSSPSTIEEREHLVQQHPELFGEDTVITALNEAREEIQQTLKEVKEAYSCIEGVSARLELPSSFSGVQPGECRPPALLHEERAVEEEEECCMDSGERGRGGGRGGAVEHQTLERDMYTLFGQQIVTYLSSIPQKPHQREEKEEREGRRNPSSIRITTTTQTGSIIPNGFSSSSSSAAAAPALTPLPAARRVSTGGEGAAATTTMIWYDVPELVLEILSYLPARDILLHAEEVCTAWQYWLYLPAISRSFWLGVVQREFPSLLLNQCLSLAVLHPGVQETKPQQVEEKKKKNMNEDKEKKENDCAAARENRSALEERSTPFTGGDSVEKERGGRRRCAEEDFSSLVSGVEKRMKDDKVEGEMGEKKEKTSSSVENEKKNGEDSLWSFDWRSVAMLGVSEEDENNRVE